MKNWRRFSGFRKTNTVGSNQRRLMARVTLIVAVYLLAAVFLPFPFGIAASYIAVLWSFIFFAVTVVWIIYLTSAAYPPDPVRLISDILVSGFFAIVSFSTIYQRLGIEDSLYVNYVPIKSDFLYFSAITFSTLGFGDFRPSAIARLVASAQAILGNLHLGLLAGAAFYALQRKTASKKIIKGNLEADKDRGNKANKSDGTD